MIKDYEIFKEKIDYAIQNSNLDIGAIYFILKNTLINVEARYYSEINKELLENSEEKKGE